MKCPVGCQTLEMKAHPAETFMEVRMSSVLKPIVEYIQQASHAACSAWYGQQAPTAG